MAWQRLVFCDRQYSHWRHSGVYSGMTWSPGLTLVTPGADLDHDAGALVAEDRRETGPPDRARQREGVGVADAGGLDLDQHLAGARAVESTVSIVSGAPALWATAALTFMFSPW
jgi:hypothetical protein